MGVTVASVLLVAVAVGAVLVVLLRQGPAPLADAPGAPPPPPPGVVARVDADVRRVSAELAAWWGPQLDGRGHPLRRPVRLTDGDDGEVCDGRSVAMDDDLLLNAWAHDCEEGPLVAWDPRLLAGSYVVLEVTIAHEWGHVAQAADRRLDVSVMDKRMLPVDGELQADCLAGAWWADARGARDLELAMEAVADSGDPPGSPVDDADAHGDADLRVAAFLTGHGGGLAACEPGTFDPRGVHAPG